jgi:general secretion pathway protein C
MQTNSLRSPNRERAARELRSALTGWLPLLASGVLVLLIAYVLALLTWQLMPQAAPAAPPPATTARAATSHTAGNALSGAAIKKVVAMHLFGVPQHGKTASKAAAMHAPETELNLTLHGLFAASHPRSSYAIIAASGGDDKEYGIGSSLPSGATIHAIYADRVILDRAGKLEALKLPQDHQQSTAISTATSASKQSASTTATPKQSASTTPASSQTSNPSASNAFAIPASSSSSSHPVNMQRLRKSIQRQPQKLMQAIRPTPVTKNGQLIGYRVYPGKDSQTFTALGLKSGDIIKSINGIALDNPKQSLKILQQLSTAAQLNATVVRNGKEQTITLSLRNH